MSFTDLALSQSSEESDDYIWDLSDTQEVVRRLTDYDLLRELDQIKDQRITNLEKEVELLKREIELKDRIIGIKDMEIQVQKRAFDDMKEVADRAIKLAETSKPKSTWETLGIIGVLAFVIGLAVGL